MTVPLQIDSYQYKCKGCHKLHLGPTRTLEFQHVETRETDRGLEWVYAADFSSACECSQTISITFKVREHPQGVFDYLCCESADAEIMVVPKVREHFVFVDA